MKKDSIDQLFENLRDNFDVEMPHGGHQDRFISKLKVASEFSIEDTSRTPVFWKPFLAIAATIVLCLGLFITLYQPTATSGLASVSPEMSTTQDFFTSTIEKELTQLNKQRTPETKLLIDDALKQMKILETDYESLKNDLSESGDDQRVIFAMISNFQMRIDVLQNVMERIHQKKQLKQTTL